MWEDLQSQIYALHGAVRGSRGPEASGTGRESGAAASTSQRPVRPNTDENLISEDDSDGSSNEEVRMNNKEHFFDGG